MNLFCFCSHGVNIYCIIQKGLRVAKVFKIAFGVWSFGVIAVLALLWLRRRSEARQRALISRKRSSRLCFLLFSAAQVEQQTLFYYYLLCHNLPLACKEEVFATSLGFVTSCRILQDIGVTASGSKNFASV